MAYAKNTTVTVEKSKAEIERLVTRAGASRFASGWEEGSASMFFDMKDKRVCFRVRVPQVEDYEHTTRGVRTKQQARSLQDREHRRLMRALLLTIKAKLEAVESGIESFEEAFLAHIMMPSSGSTIGEWAVPQLLTAYEDGKPLPPLLGSGKRR